MAAEGRGVHEGEGEGAERAGKIASTCGPWLSQGLQEDHAVEIGTGRDSVGKVRKVVSDFRATTVEGWLLKFPSYRYAWKAGLNSSVTIRLNRPLWRRWCIVQTCVDVSVKSTRSSKSKLYELTFKISVCSSACRDVTYRLTKMYFSQTIPENNIMTNFTTTAAH